MHKDEVQNDMEKLHLDNALAGAAIHLAQDSLINIPEDELNKIVPPRNLLNNIRQKIRNDENKTIINKSPRRLFRTILVAALIFICIMSIAALTVTAARISFFNTLLGIKDSTIQYKETIKSDSLSIKYAELSKINAQLTFRILVPRYVPQELDEFIYETSDNIKKLNLYYSGHNKYFTFRQTNPLNGNSSKGSSMDTENTSVEEIKISDVAIKVFIMDTPNSENRKAYKWSLNNMNYTVDSNLDKNEVLKMLESLYQLK